MVRDNDAVHDLIPVALETIRDDAKLAGMSEAARKMALPKAAEMIVDEIELLIKQA